MTFRSFCLIRIRGLPGLSGELTVISSVFVLQRSRNLGDILYFFPTPPRSTGSCASQVSRPGGLLIPDMFAVGCSRF